MTTLVLQREWVKRKTNFPVVISKYVDGTEQRRSMVRKPAIIFEIQGSIMRKAAALALQDFYNARFGSLQSFDFLCPLDDTTYTVRFEENSFDVSYRNAVWKVKFTLVVINQEEVA